MRVLDSESDQSSNKWLEIFLTFRSDVRYRIRPPLRSLPESGDMIAHYQRLTARPRERDFTIIALAAYISHALSSPILEDNDTGLARRSIATNHDAWQVTVQNLELVEWRFKKNTRKLPKKPSRGGSFFLRG